MSDLLIDLSSWACLLTGGLFCAIGALGLLRFPDFYTRMHAASVTDTVGAALILLGLILQAGVTLVAAKLVMIGLLLYFTGPVAGHALAKAAMKRGLLPLLADAAPSSSPAPTSPLAAATQHAASPGTEDAPSKP